jgi:hypothetical protein
MAKILVLVISYLSKYHEEKIHHVTDELWLFWSHSDPFSLLLPDLSTSSSDQPTSSRGQKFKNKLINYSKNYNTVVAYNSTFHLSWKRNIAPILKAFIIS